MDKLLLTGVFSPAQILGYAGMGLSLSFGAVTSDRLMRFLGVITCAVWTIHYVMLGATTAACQSFLIGSGVTVLALLPKDKRTWRFWIMGLFSCAFLWVAYLTWNGYLSIFPLIAALVSTYACGVMTGTRARKQLMVSDFCWLVTGLLAGSIGGVLSGVLAIILKINAVFRLKVSERLA